MPSRGHNAPHNKKDPPPTRPLDKGESSARRDAASPDAPTAAAGLAKLASTVKERVARKLDDRQRKRASRKDRFSSRKDKQRVLLSIDLGKLPSYSEISPYLLDEAAAIDYFRSAGVIDVPDQCPRCSHPTVCSDDRRTVRCRRKACSRTAPAYCEKCPALMAPKARLEDGTLINCECTDKNCAWEWKSGKEYECSYFRGSILQGSKVPKNEVLHLLYLWALKIRPNQAATMLAWNKDAAGRWLKHVRQMVGEVLMSGDARDLVLGGPGIIVEVDESKFGKRKYNRGRRANGDWVLGLVERTTARRCVMVVVKDRSKQTLLPLIERFVAPGSTVHSDMWGGYVGLDELEGCDFTHKTLCHDHEFVAEDGTHTQTIEGNWGACKRDIPLQTRNGADLQDYLFEFMWRRKNEDRIWGALLEGLSMVRYTPSQLQDTLYQRVVNMEDEDDDWEEFVQMVSSGSLSADSYCSTDSNNSTAWIINKDHAAIDREGEAKARKDGVVSPRKQRHLNRSQDAAYFPSDGVSSTNGL